ncbi:MAG: hypothetical protein ACR2QW_19570 [bacterium]
MKPMMDTAGAYIDSLLALATRSVGTWVNLRTHRWNSLYAWETTPLFNCFGDQIGCLEANTIYISRSSPCPEEDLLHELGHAVARKFDLIGHRDNGFIGHWEKRHFRLVGGVRHQHHWSRLLERVRTNAPPYTSDLASEIWAELFMCWHLYPYHREITFIAPEMDQLEREPFIESIDRFVQIIDL